MLIQPIITALVPTTNPDLAKDFYINTLGLTLMAEDNYALELKGKGSILRITTVSHFTPYPFTILGFRINDIVASVQNLVAKGVSFEKYDALKQDALGIWTSPSTAQVAWFKDPDGNLLSVTQYPT